MRFFGAFFTQVAAFTALIGCSALFGSDLDLSLGAAGAAGVNSTKTGGNGPGSGGTGGMRGSGGSRSPSGGRDAGAGGATGGEPIGAGASSGGVGAHPITDGSVHPSSGGTPGGNPTDVSHGDAEGGTGIPDAPAEGGTRRRDAESGVPNPHPVGSGGDADAHPDVARPRPPRGVLWNSQSSPLTFVYVCFTVAPHVEWDGTERCKNQVGRALSCSGDPFEGTDYAALRQSFMDLIRDTWSRATNLEFLDYECGTMTVPFPPLMVSFVTKGADPEPLTESVTGLGSHAFPSDLHVDWKGLRDRDPKVLRTILRETGHILGFPYEWLRGTGPGNGPPFPCPANYAKDPDFDFITNPFENVVDYFSVMDRCTPDTAPPPGLSPGDVIGAQWLYGNKLNGSLVGYRGFCADVDKAIAAAGTQVIAFPCRGQPNDSWCRCSTDTPRFEASLSNGRCMAVSGNAVSPSGFTPVVSDACDQSEGQRFPLANVEWRAMGNMCLADKTDRIELALCDGSAEQKWNFLDADPTTPVEWDQIQSAQTGNCVTTHYVTPELLDGLSLAPCVPSDPRQHFRYIGDGFIRYGDGPIDLYSACFNVLDGRLAVGSVLGLWSECGNPLMYHSRFYVSGAIKSFDQCLSTHARPFAPYDQVGVEPCTPGSPKQTWDYHFRP